MIGAVVQVGAHHEVRWTPGRGCGHGPPYSGTLHIWADYGLPWAWLEVGTYEKCTTATSIIPWDFIRIKPEGLILNLATYGVLVLLINNRWRKREDKIIE